MTPSPKTSVKILIDQSHNEPAISFPENIYNSEEYLFDFTASGDTLADSETLKKYNIVLIIHPKPKNNTEKLFTPEEIKNLKSFVKDGGSLLISTSARGDYNVSDEFGSLKALYMLTGISHAHFAVLFSQNADTYFDSRMNLLISDIPKHPIFKNFKKGDKIYFGKSTYFSLYEEGTGKIILTAPAGISAHSYRNKQRKPLVNAPIIVTNKYGQGKVLEIGSSDIFLFKNIPETQLKSNEQLTKGIIDWLVSKKEE